MQSPVNSFVKQLDVCPAGMAGWHTFETLCVDILKFLFTPALKFNSHQAKTLSGISRMDAIFSNRNLTNDSNPDTKNWHHFFIELAARLILFEFKNYDKEDIAKDEVDQIRNYLTEPMGRLAIVISNKKPSDVAFKQRNIVFNREKKVILFLTKNELKEMLYMKERGEQPSDLLVDLLEAFYIQHE